MKLKFNKDNEIDISKVVCINVPKNFIHIDQLKDGSFRLTYSKGLIGDTKTIENIEIIREKKEKIS